MSSDSDPTPPPVGRARLGDLRRTSPISDVWGTDRGQPVDRWYIEGFLARQAGDICGRVLEVTDARYTRRFGKDAVTQADVVDIDPSNPNATIVADLTHAPQIEESTYDCVVLTQVLPVIFDLNAAVDTVHRILKPGGVLLLTVPGPFSPAFRGGRHEELHWAFYPETVGRLLERSFERSKLQVESHGNLVACASFIAGLALEDLTAADLAEDDPCYPLSVAARAVKATPQRPGRPKKSEAVAP